MSWVVLRYELLALVRDTRTLFLSIFLPIILLPVLLFTLHRFGQNQFSQGPNEDIHIGRAIGSEHLSPLMATAFGQEPFREMLVEQGEQMLDEGHLDLVIRLAPGGRSDPDLAKSLVEAFPGLEPMIDEENPGRPILELLYRSDRDRSVRSYLLANQALKDLQDDLVGALIESHAASVGVKLEAKDVSSVQDRAARRYGPALSAFMILMLLGGGSVAALDSLAGERERGTLSTLFVSSLERSSILWAKFCAVALISVVVAVTQMLNLLVYVLMGWVELPIAMSPGAAVGAFASLTAIFLVEAVFTAAALLNLSARSSSFKEAQLFFFPTFLISFAMSLSGLLPGISSRSVVSALPLAGPGLLIPEILQGRVDYLVLAFQLAVHLGAAWLLMRSTLHRITREDFLGGQPPQVGAALRFEKFSQRALPIYAVLAAALLVVPSNFEILMNLQGQGIFNQLVLFGLGPYLLLRFYKQDLRKVVPFKPVSWKILVLCVFLVPLGQLAATGLSHLLGSVLPAPIEAMKQMLEVLDIENTPPWQLFVLIGILPGIFEEFAFRGVLLHALHRRFGPWMLAGVVALVFGLFHINYYRVFPTAYLGFFMALLTLATGSVLPAMLVHIGNNSLAVMGMLGGWDFEGFSNFVYFAGFVGQVALTVFVIRWGRGYPGTRWHKAETSGEPKA